MAIPVRLHEQDERERQQLRGEGRHEISGPLEYHIKIFPSSLYVVPFIFKAVFICVHSENEYDTPAVQRFHVWERVEDDWITGGAGWRN